MKCIAKVDELECLAHGDCALVAPDVFSVDDVAHVIGDAPPETLIAAAEACPTGAISVVDVDTGEDVYP